MKLTKNQLDNWVETIKKIIVQESTETEITFKILVKILYYKSGVKQDKPTKDEINFLKDHSKDLLKIIGFILTLPIPFPVIPVLILLQKLGVNLLPRKESLNIPDNYK
jgi:hypothetical protein